MSEPYLVPEVLHLTGVRCELCGEGRSRGVGAYRGQANEVAILCYHCAAQVIAWFYGWRP